jgi:hypothetical protein
MIAHIYNITASFLKTGKTTACFHKDGNVSLVELRLKIEADTGIDMGTSHNYKRWNSTNLHTHTHTLGGL